MKEKTLIWGNKIVGFALYLYAMGLVLEAFSLKYDIGRMLLLLVGTILIVAYICTNVKLEALASKQSD